MRGQRSLPIWRRAWRTSLEARWRTAAVLSATSVLLWTCTGTASRKPVLVIAALICTGRGHRLLESAVTAAYLTGPGRWPRSTDRITFACKRS